MNATRFEIEFSRKRRGREVRVKFSVSLWEVLVVAYLFSLVG